MSLRKIIIYGTLRKFCGQSSFEAVINKPKDVFSFLKANFPDLENHMGNQLYKIKVNGKTLDNPDINMRGDIQVIPLVIGAGDVGKIFKFAIGIAIYYYTGGFAALGVGSQASVIAGFQGAKLVSTIVQTVGATMAVSGASALLGGGQNYNNQQDFNLADPNLRASYSFNNISNVVAAGTPIPIIYGEILTGSIVISSGVDTLQVRRDIEGAQPFSSEDF